MGGGLNLKRTYTDDGTLGTQNELLITQATPGKTYEVVFSGMASGAVNFSVSNADILDDVTTGYYPSSLIIVFSRLLVKAKSDKFTIRFGTTYSNTRMWITMIN